MRGRRLLGWLTAVLLCVAMGSTTVMDGWTTTGEEPLSRHKRHAPEDRPICEPGAVLPPTVTNTTDRLWALRQHFGNVSGGAIHAYIIPTPNAHGSTSLYDQRRKYISGFSGTAGTAVVLAHQAALWTDGRYFLEAERALDCNWILMKSGLSGVPSISTWLKSQLENVTNARVGASPFFMTARSWAFYSSSLSQSNITLVELRGDLVDKIWTSANGRPAQPNTPINALPMEFAGKSWQDKMADVRAGIQAKGAAAYVVSSLDETAWLFNLRASDIVNSPFYISYAIVEPDRVRLFIIDHATKLSMEPTDPATNVKLHQHLNTGTSGTCSQAECVEVLEYSESAISTAIAALATGSNKVWMSLSCNQAIYSAVPQDENRIHDKSAIALMKSRKNDVERQGMQNGHIRDAVAVMEFIQRLEKEVKDGHYWSEVTAAEALKQQRLQQEHNRGLSFDSISAFGPNGAVIHYFPTNATDLQITTDNLYLLDSGGQYLDTTTDVTRTFHFGTPTDYQKICYTHVLMGHIDLVMLKWPRGLYGRQVDVITRAPLWSKGLDYRHGTGHGIGAYLGVHEGPGFISVAASGPPWEEPLQEHMFFSDEPGYYQDGEFGIRLENIMEVEVAETDYTFGNAVYLGFRPITLVPYEPHLIKYELLSHRQIAWLEAYHKRVEDEVGPLLSPEAREWMLARTRYRPVITASTAPQQLPTPLSFLIAMATLVKLQSGL